MRESIEALRDRIDESLRTSDERIVAANDSWRQTNAYISISREAIGHSNRQLARLRGSANELRNQKP